MNTKRLEFIIESNLIEGIKGEPSRATIEAHEKFWELSEVTVADLEAFVSVVAARRLRRNHGENVRVGSYVAPPGGPGIEQALTTLLYRVNELDISPYWAHHRYERLHPFLDGNGRSGRVLWSWHMMAEGYDPFRLPFLHRWYYDSLSAERDGGVSL